jgi:hypothetical protein
VKDGVIESSSGSAIAAPAPLSIARRDNDFLVTNIATSYFPVRASVRAAPACAGARIWKGTLLTIPIINDEKR